MEKQEKERDWAAFLAAQQGLPRGEAPKMSSKRDDNVLRCHSCAHREVCMHVPTMERMREELNEVVRDIQSDAHVASGLTVDIRVFLSCPQYAEYVTVRRGDGG